MGALRTARSTRSPRTRNPLRQVAEPGKGCRFLERLARSPGRVAVMGILNVTPDSFSDGGRFFAPEAAVERARSLVEEGADLIDVGGESTRPGSEAVSEEEELRRVLPVIRAIRAVVHVPVSVDTTKAAVAEAALDEGASIVNDVSAGRADRRMFAVVARRGAGIILMHRRGTPKTMQRRPRYREVVAEVRRFLENRAEAARRAGIAPEGIAVDPGIGFGKNLQHNLELLRRLRELSTLGYVLAVGASRKSFLGRLLDGRPADERLEGSLAAALHAASAGAQLVRVHDVGPTVRALRVAQAIWGAR